MLLKLYLGTIVNDV